MTPSVAHSSDGSLGDFSVENYTVDLARLGNVVGEARPVGFEQAFHHTRQENPRLQPTDTRNEDFNEDQQNNQHAECPSQGHDKSDDEDNDFMEDYEIDLGGLGDKQSSLVVEDVVHPREEVPSEDDGPDDFTQNMEAWMRGGKIWKAEQSKPLREERDPDPDPEPSLPKSAIGNAEESLLEPLEASPPASRRNRVTDGEHVKGGSKPEAPPLSRLNTEMLQDKAAEEVFDRISALQTEVESMRLEDEARRLAHQNLAEDHGKLGNDYASVRAEYEKKFDALQSDYENLQQAHANTREALRRENQDLTQEYNAVMEQLRLSENHATSEQNINLETLKEKLESAVQELESVKSQAQLETNAAKAQMEGLNRELKAANHDSSELNSQIESLRSSHNRTLKDLETELNARRKEVSLERQESFDRANEATALVEENSRKEKELSELTGEIGSVRAQLRQAHEQLEETRRIVQTVEDENDRLVQQNERHVEKIAELEAIVTNTETAEAQTLPNPAHQTTSSDKQAIVEELHRQHHTTLASLGADHGKEIQDLRNALLKASEGMKKREVKLMKRHQAQVDSLDRQIAALTQEQGRAATSSGAVEKELRSAIRVLSNKLEKANASADSGRLEATRARQQADEIQQENAIVNAELESGFAKAIEERENEWARRVDLLFREREKMGKALMWGWGREELGPKSAIDREQAYRYKLSRKT